MSFLSVDGLTPFRMFPSRFKIGELSAENLIREPTDALCVSQKKFGYLYSERLDGLLVLADALLYQYVRSWTFLSARNFQPCFRFENSLNSAA